MKIFSTRDIKTLDSLTIEYEPITSIDLMERAAHVLTEAFMMRWGSDTPVVVFAGPGNNGGDALAMARMLGEAGYEVEAYLFDTKGSLSPDCETNKQRLDGVWGVTLHEITTQFAPPVLTDAHVLLDGLFGSGLNKPLSGGFAAVVKYINASAATVVSIDVPSGLMGEDNTHNTRAHIVRADLTLSLQLPKLAFFFAENEEVVGEWQLLDIGLSERAMAETETDYLLTEHDDIAGMLKPRTRFAHKGTFGKALLVAGSRGMAGASVLAAKACLRSGVGTLTVHLPRCNNEIMQVAVPEAMTRLDVAEHCFSSPLDADEFRAVAVGPGIGRAVDTEIALSELISSCSNPMVVDADALNILSGHRSHLSQLPAGSILTPHPAELERLVGKCASSYERLSRARELASNCNLYVVLKGAYSAVVTPEGKCYFNPTGNPGMATGGSGDVLTGVILALLAQGYGSEQAARIAVYVHGLAGDIAKERYGEIGMTAGDIVSCLPAAWKRLVERS